VPTDPRTIDPNAVILRPVCKDDYSFLLNVYATTRSEELAQTGMDQAQQDVFIDLQFRAQDADYRHRFPNAAYSVIELAGQPVGRLYVDRRKDEIRILDVTIMPTHRSQGIGTRLLQELIDEAREAGQPLTIYLDNGSASIRLFERLGFRPTEPGEPVTLFEWSATR